MRFRLRAEDVRTCANSANDPRLHRETAAGGGVRGVVRRRLLACETRYPPAHPSPSRPDNYLLLADFASYLEAQARVDALYATPAAWAERAWRNIAGMGTFSADRTVAEYARRIWALPGG